MPYSQYPEPYSPEPPYHITLKHLQKREGQGIEGLSITPIIKNKIEKVESEIYRRLDKIERRQEDDFKYLNH